MPTEKVLQPVWRPEDAHEVFERPATVQAIRALTETDPRLAESPVLADIMDCEFGA
jgi:L-alanine-DL-glutamate epimerase-like enolase superfamily enzyme